MYAFSLSKLKVQNNPVVKFESEINNSIQYNTNRFDPGPELIASQEVRPLRHPKKGVQLPKVFICFSPHWMNPI